jgi:hypothetical protein
MALPTFVAKVDNSGASNSPSCAAPAGVQSGDYQLMVITSGSGSETMSTVPTGWTLVGSTTGTTGAAGASTRAFWVYESTTDTGTATFTKSGTRGWLASRHAWRGHGGRTINAVLANDETAATTIASPAISTLRADSLVIFAAYNDMEALAAGTWSVPSGWNERSDFNAQPVAGDNSTLLVADRPTAAVTSNVSATFTSTVNVTASMVSIVLEPGSDTPPPVSNPNKRLYLTAVAPTYTPATRRGAWDNTTTTVAMKLGEARAGTNTTSARAETSNVNNYDVFLGRWISDEDLIKTAGVISGSMLSCIARQESNTAANMYKHVHVYVTVGSSDVVRGTLITDDIGPVEWSTTMTANEDTVVVSDVAVQPGDRIVVEVGYRAVNTSTTSYTGTIRYGGTATTDLVDNDTTNATSRSPWVEFTDPNGVFFAPQVRSLVSTWLGPDALQVRVGTETSGTIRAAFSASSAMTSPVYSTAVTPDSLGNARITLPALSADTAYYYQVESESILIGSPVAFRTLPTTNFLVGFASCRDHSQNLPSTNPTALTNAISKGIHLFIETGDFHYRNITTNDPTQFRAAYDELHTRSNIATLLSTVPTDYTWSDHDYAGDDSNGSAAARPAAQSVYRERVPYGGTLPSASGGIYHTYVIGRVRFIILDTRSYRSASANTDNSTKTMLGSEQKAWLQNLLANPTTPVTAIVSAEGWIGAGGSGIDHWGAYSTERTEIGGWITASTTEAVFLCGDAHMLAYDSGANAVAGTPVFHAAALNAAGSTKGGPYSGGSRASQNAYGTLDFVDNGSNLAITYRGYYDGGTLWSTYTHTVYTGPTVDAGADATGVVGQVFSRTATDNGQGSTITSRSWAIISGPDRIGEVLSNAAAMSFTPTAAGTYILRYTATNARGSTTDDVTLTVSPPPGAPTVNAGADASVTVSSAFTRTATETLNNSPITSREWRVVSGPFDMGVVIGTAAALNWTPTASGTYTLRYTATASAGAGTDELVLTVDALPATPTTPELITAYSSGYRSVGTAWVSPTFTPEPGEVIVVRFGNGQTNSPAGNTPTATGLTFAQPTGVSAPGTGTSNCDHIVWVATAGANPVSTAISCTPSAATGHGWTVERWRGGSVAANPATNATKRDTTAPHNGTVTTTQVNSVISGGIADYNAVAPGTPNYAGGIQTIAPIYGSGIYTQYTWHHLAPTVGTYTVGMSAPTGQSASIALFEIRGVAGGSPAPTGVSAGADVSGHYTNAAFTRTATDAGTVTRRQWQVISGPANVNDIIGTAAALSWTPTLAGTYVLRYSAANTGGTVTDDMTLTVVDPTPIVNAGADASVIRDTVFTRTATESGGGGITSRSWYVVSGPSHVDTVIGTTATLNFSPTAVGTYVIRYTATNPVGQGTDELSLTVTYPAPTANAGVDVTGHALGSALTRTATEDLKGATATSREWRVLAGPAQVNTVVGTAAALNWTPTVAGDYTLRYNVVTAGGTGTDQASINVVHYAPVVNAGADVASHLVNTAFTRTATESGHAITARGWTVAAGPDRVGETLSTTTAVSFTPLVVGTYTLRFTASSAGGTTTDDITIVVIGPPIVNAGADASVVNRTAFNRVATETGGGGVTARSWTVVAGPQNVGDTIGVTANLNWTPTYPGAYTLRYSATNPQGTATDDLILTVTAVSIGISALATVESAGAGDLVVNTRLNAPASIPATSTITAGQLDRITTLRKTLTENVTASGELDVRRRLTLAAVAVQSSTLTVKTNLRVVAEVRSSSTQDTTAILHLRRLDRFERETVRQDITAPDVNAEVVTAVAGLAEAESEISNVLNRRTYFNDRVLTAEASILKRDLLPPYTALFTAKSTIRGRLSIIPRYMGNSARANATATGRLRSVYRQQDHKVTQQVIATPKLIGIRPAYSDSTQQVRIRDINLERATPLIYAGPIVARSVVTRAADVVIRLVAGRADGVSDVDSGEPISIPTIRKVITQPVAAVGRGIRVADVKSQSIQQVRVTRAALIRARLMLSASTQRTSVSDVRLARVGAFVETVSAESGIVAPLRRRIRYRQHRLTALAYLSEREARFVVTTALAVSATPGHKNLNVFKLNGYVTAIGTLTGELIEVQPRHLAFQQTTLRGNLVRLTELGEAVGAKSKITDRISVAGILSTVIAVLEEDPRMAPRPDFIEEDPEEEPIVYDRAFTRLR